MRDVGEKFAGRGKDANSIKKIYNKVVEEKNYRYKSYPQRNSENQKTRRRVEVISFSKKMAKKPQKAK